jgi:hypothetical protein
MKSMENLEIYKKLKSVPEEAKKKITGGRLSGMSDINPMWRIKKLTEEFGICGIGWKYVITKQWIEIGGKEEKAAFVNIDLFIKVDSAWSEAIPGTGGSSFIAAEKNGLYTSDECFKMALTDAISVACKALGMGADVYFEKDRTKYDQSPAATLLPKQPELSPEIEKQLTQSIALLDNITDLEKLKAVWESQPELQGIKIFKDSVNAAKTRLTPKN